MNTSKKSGSTEIRLRDRRTDNNNIVLNKKGFRSKNNDNIQNKKTKKVNNKKIKKSIKLINNFNLFK